MTSNMVTYLVPSAAELPSFELDRTETPSPTNPLGVQGVGETGTIASARSGDQRRRRCAVASRRDRRPDACQPRTGLARDPGGEAVIPAPFDYEVAQSVEHAVELLGGDADAKLLAGGHSLVPAMKLRLARPSKLVDLGRLSDLSYVRDAGEHVAIGALTRHKDVAGAALLQEHCPLVSTTAAQIGDPQVRHRGTIGGSLAHGDPASDLPTVIAGARRGACRPGGRRGARDPRGCILHRGVPDGAGTDEMLVEVRVPKLAASSGSAYLKAHRRAQDWATVAVAAWCTARTATWPARP